MSKGKDTVITAYGHKDVIDSIAVSVFDKPEPNHYGWSDESNAAIYCNTLNALKLEDESWVFAKIVSENTPYSLDALYPPRFDMLLKFDDRTLQRVIRELDSQDLAKALKDEKDTLKEKIFCNMSARAAQILKEDMEVLGQLELSAVKKCQKKIIDTIYLLARRGEIAFPFVNNLF